MQIGERLRTIRKKKGLTQEEVANALGICRQAYSRYEIGLRTMSLEKAIQLAAFYKMSLDKMLNVSPKQVN